MADSMCIGGDGPHVPRPGSRDGSCAFAVGAHVGAIAVKDKSDNKIHVSDGDDDEGAGAYLFSTPPVVIAGWAM